MAFGPQDSPGLYVPNTFILDMELIENVDLNSPEFREQLINLYQNLNLIAISLNQKTNGAYPLTEINSSQQLFAAPDSITSSIPAIARPIYIKAIDFGALPNNGTKSVAHDIKLLDTFVPGNPTTYSAVNIYGGATDQAAKLFFPLPYTSTTGDHIQLNFDGTNVNITTLSNRTNFTVTCVILEYVKF